MEDHFNMMMMYLLFFFFLVLVVSSTIGGDYKVINFTQKLDHFGYFPQINDITFEQKVFVNDTHWGGAKAKAPIFVLFGGETGDTYGPDYVGIMSLSGVRFRALLIHIQHRFYGDSIPLGSIDLAMENYHIRGCLTTEQALRDFAVIIMSVKANYSAYSSPVIVMGCGYAGALAAWFRLTYPQIVIGALASSTPLLYYGNYTSKGGFCDTVSRVFEDVDPTCYRTVRQSWDEIDDIASQPDGLKNLSHILNTCRPLQSAEEAKQWFGQMLSFAAKYVDSNNELIRNVCKRVGVMVDNVLEGMAYALQPKIYSEPCLEGQYLIKVESPFEIPTKTTLAWEWQRCTELVFPVGCGDKTMLLPKPFDRNEFDDSCRKRFGVTPRPHTPISVFQSHVRIINLKLNTVHRYLAENPFKETNSFDQKTYLRMFADAIMYHGYSLRIVEHVKLRELHSYLNPNVIHVSRNTILAYCLKEHDRLRVSLLDSLSKVSSRICFTTDCWSSNVTSRGYLALTAHYIDDNWKLKSHIFNFRYFPPPHRGRDIYSFVIDLIKNWNLEGKAFSMTCDNASSMDVMASFLKDDLHSRCRLPCDGEFFHVRCCAHILNLIVQSGMKVIDDSVLKLRAACSYIDGSDHRVVKFNQCVSEKCPDFVGNLKLDCVTRWNSTFLMLNKAILARDAFDQYALLDSNFDYSLSTEEWEIVKFVCSFLEPFYEITVLFSGCEYPTANLYFHNIVAIEKLLEMGHSSKIECIKNMSKIMLEKFEKYWSDYSILLSIAVMLDPRYKLNLVRNHLSHLYVESAVEEKIKKIKDSFVKLYQFYDVGSTSSTSSNSVSSVPSRYSMTSLFESFESANASGSDALTAIDAYLNTSLHPRVADFSVLNFWKVSSSSHPTLARMAKDILAVPITSVASESSFSMGSRTLTKYRASLLPKNVEALVCTQNWLFGYSTEDEVDSDFEVVKEACPNDIDYDSLPKEG